MLLSCVINIIISNNTAGITPQTPFAAPWGSSTLMGSISVTCLIGQQTSDSITAPKKPSKRCLQGLWCKSNHQPWANPEECRPTFEFGQLERSRSYLKVGVSASEQADIIQWPSAALECRSNVRYGKPANSSCVTASNVFNSLRKVKVLTRCWDRYWQNSFCSPNLNVWGRWCRPTLLSQWWDYPIQTFHLLINACAGNRKPQKDAIKQTKMPRRCCKWSLCSS